MSRAQGRPSKRSVGWGPEAPRGLSHTWVCFFENLSLEKTVFADFVNCICFLTVKFCKYKHFGKSLVIFATWKNSHILALDPFVSGRELLPTTQYVHSKGQHCHLVAFGGIAAQDFDGSRLFWAYLARRFAPLQGLQLVCRRGPPPVKWREIANNMLNAVCVPQKTTCQARALIQEGRELCIRGAGLRAVY